MTTWLELRKKWQQLTAEEQTTLIDSMTREEIDAINWWYVQLAREKQLPPEGDWLIWLIRSGRGFGKTRTGSEWCLQRVRDGYKYIALIGQTKADVRDTMVELGDSSIMKVAPPGWKPEYQPSKRRLVWPNGAVAQTFSGDEPDQLRGPQFDTAWVDELAKFKYPEDTMDNLEFGLRLGTDPRMVITTTPRPIPVLKALIVDTMAVDVVGSSYENEANLAVSYQRRILNRYEGTRLGRQEIHGDILSDVLGALWSREILDATRVNAFPEPFRIAVGVDPHATTGETGIVVAGISQKSGVIHAYVLDDATTGGTPATWAAAAISTYHKWKADIMIGEVNNGGDMVEHTIRSVDGGANINYKKVRATRGKLARAEPIAALYEQSRIHHVGRFSELEDQQCEYVPGETKSPNNLDALVWAMNELMLESHIMVGPRMVRYA